jgi:membrane dipeptidase
MGSRVREFMFASLEPRVPSLEPLTTERNQPLMPTLRSHRRLIPLLGLIAAIAFPALSQPAADLLDEARAILREVPMVDGHNDLPWEVRRRVSNQLDRIDLRAGTTDLEPPMHTDIPRLREGGVGAIFWSVYVPVSTEGSEAVKTVIEQIDLVHRLCERYPDVFELALTADDVVRIHSEGRIASMIGMEGGHAIDDSLAALRQFHRMGARYMTLTHSDSTAWADSATAAPEHRGITPFGEEVVREMNRLGMLVDLSHVSPATMHAVLDLTAAPVIFSHSSARALTDHPRNVPDDVLRRLEANGGVVMVTFVPTFVSEERRQWWAARAGMRERLASLYPGDPGIAEQKLAEWEGKNPPVDATLADVADHIDHLRDAAGIDHIGIGSDFDGISSVPVGLEDVTTFPHLLAELLRRGYSADDLRKIVGLNVLRAMREAERVAAGLQRTTLPSEVVFESE